MNPFEGLWHKRAAILAAAAVLLGGCTIFGIGVQRRGLAQLQPDAPVLVTREGRQLTGRALKDVAALAEKTLSEAPLSSKTFREASEKASPAVVNIYIQTADPYEVSLLIIGLPLRLPGKALGSGFFVHPSGYVLTNNHVVENARQIKAKTTDGKTYELVVMARDPAIDVALLRVDTQGATFPYIPLGNSSEVGLGDWVIAIGNPLGLGHTVTQGIVSQTSREIPELERSPGRHVKFIQTDAAINPGNSGGPLLTLTGAAIGINSAVAMGAQGIAFAVPMDQVREFLSGVLAGSGSLDTDRP